MINSLINHPETTLPSLLLLMAFLFKLLIDRRITFALAIASLYELPVDIAFLATSFVVAFTIYSPQNTNLGLANLFIYLAFTILVVLFWRRSVFLFEQDQHWLSILVFVLNICLSATLLSLSIQLLTGVSP
ncbi:MAG: hypothetical protein ACPGWR_17845 [Ardenticatenaceae bacterium]